MIAVAMFVLALLLAFVLGGLTTLLVVGAGSAQDALRKAQEGQPSK